jgi:recombination protein RecA
MDKPVLRLGGDEYFKPVKIPTGSLSIDRITGGGFTTGRHIELFGHYSAGKSYVGLKTIALAQQRGGICALVDPEKVFDPVWFTHLGGIPDELLLFQPEKEWNAEDAVGVMMILADLVDDEAVEIVMIDSIASMVTQEEMSKDPRAGDDRVASQARMMSRAMRRITTMNKKTLFIWTNQERSNIGRAAIFQPTTTPGGRAMSFYATTRIEFKKTGKVKAKKKVATKMSLVEKEMPVGEWIQVRAEKEKSTRPYQQATFIFDNEAGRIDPYSEIIQLGLEDELIERHGNKFQYESFDGEEWIGTEKQFRNHLIENDDLLDELIDAISDMTLEKAKANDGT